MNTKDAILLHPADNVATALRRIEAGETVSIAGSDHPLLVISAEAIPMFHKIAIKPLEPGADVQKYGDSIGLLISDVDEGDHVHIHNLRSKRAAI